jgi:transcriptional regulator with XRE-family HTH domain
MEWYEKLRVLRHINRWSQEEFAAKIGVSKGMVSQYEMNRSIPSLKTMEKIINVLEVSSDILFFDKSDKLK